jgi:hypothetical protein
MFCPVVSADGWKGSSTKMEPLNFYIEIKLPGLVEQRMKVIKQNEAPSWNEEFLVYV